MLRLGGEGRKELGDGGFSFFCRDQTTRRNFFEKIPFFLDAFFAALVPRRKCGFRVGHPLWTVGLTWGDIAHCCPAVGVLVVATCGLRACPGGQVPSSRLVKVNIQQQ